VNSNRGRAGQFKPGPDSRRGKNGPLTQGAKTWGILVKNSLAKKMPPAEYAELLLKHARLGRPWAILEVGERLIGKEQQPITGDLTHILRFKFGVNGNGNTNGD
jgi:hypothetical protein